MSIFVLVFMFMFMFSFSSRIRSRFRFRSRSRSRFGAPARGRSGGPLLGDSLVDRCRANTAHVRQSRPNSGLGLKVKALETHPTYSPLPSEEGTLENVSKTVDFKPRPEFGLDCRVYAICARQRLRFIFGYKCTR